MDDKSRFIAVYGTFSPYNHGRTRGLLEGLELSSIVDSISSTSAGISVRNGSGLKTFYNFFGEDKQLLEWIKRFEGRHKQEIFVHRARMLRSISDSMLDLLVGKELKVRTYK